MAITTSLSKLSQVPLREAWKHEANDFTPWLAEADNLNALADALGISELVRVATEHWVGEFKLDILCTDGDDQVIIENQLEKTDHTHLGQIIAYAAGVGARKVIWVAEKFRPEHAAALQFLNDNTTDDLGFFAVEVELWRIGDSPLAPKFEVVVKPDNWTKASREQVRAASATTPIKQLQQKFWIALKEYLAQHAPNIRPQQARPQHWLNNSIGRSGFGLNVTANARDERFGIQLYIHSAQAKQHFDNLYAQKVDIEAKLGFALDWQRLEDAQATRIAAWLPNASIENEARWPEYQAWISQQLVKMDAVLRPIVRALP
ncbi:DUF4268 domain-containing protein [Bordetella hinzii]|uniref:DUF4268 domain-containing protein n=1 Tax=Bordetella hinzii TaxID=103855 RepID=UPI0039FD9CD8